MTDNRQLGAEGGVSPLRRILVANRGEIALRIIRACHEEGLEAVAVYSDADRLSPHVRAANAAVALGAPPAAESYLDIAKLIAAATATGCQAIHPGYGFLSERETFARAVQDAGLIFVGPPPAAIKAMGDKTEARRRMQAAGIPVVPGTAAPVRDAAEARRETQRLGLPVLLKAASGGGGKGMRLVRALDEIESALRGAHNEAEKAFGAGAVYIEKYLERPRHIEIQILADRSGRVVSLGERECSIQRRHQKLIEEAPSAAVSPALRRRLGEAATAAAGAVGYLGPGTTDSLLAKLLAWGETREMAIRRMRRALRELVIVGLPTSQSFHLRVMDDPAFLKGEIDITYLERIGAQLLAAAPPADLVQAVAVAAALLADERRAEAKVGLSSDSPSVRQSVWLDAARREGLRQ